MESEELTVEALKVVRLRDKLLTMNTKEAKRLLKERKIRKRYDDTSDYKKLLKQGRIDLIDKDLRSNLFTPYSSLQTAYYDYYKPRKQRDEDNYQQIQGSSQTPTTDADFYDDNNIQDSSQPQAYSQQVYNQSTFGLPPLGQLALDSTNFSQLPFSQSSFGQISLNYSETPFSTVFPQMVQSAENNSLSKSIVPSNIGYLPSNNLIPNSSGKVLPQKKYTTPQAFPLNPPLPPPPSYNPYNVLANTDEENNK